MYKYNNILNNIELISNAIIKYINQKLINNISNIRKKQSNYTYSIN